MHDELLFSIIVPAHNVESYIVSCLESIAAQMDAAHELIVIDDGSSDATPLLLAQLQQRYAGLNFRCLRQDNAGVSAARNRGLSLALGEYIVFVDSDDILRPGALAAIAQAAIAHRPDVIACDLMLWYPARDGKKTRVGAGYLPDAFTYDKDQIFTVYLHDRHMYLWSKIFRRSIFTRQGAVVFPPQRVFEDVTVLPHLLGNCRNLYYLPYSIIDYRQRAGSISKRIEEKHCLDLAAAFLSVSAYFRLAEVGPATRTGFDHTMGHVYIRLFKDTYQLPLRSGSRVRSALRDMFAQALINPAAQLFDGPPPAAADTGAYPVDRLSRKNLRQLRMALDGNFWFGLRQAIAGKIKRWREQARTPGRQASGKA